MTDPTKNDTPKSAADEVSQMQPVANPDADAEADQDNPSTGPANLFTADDES